MMIDVDHVVPFAGAFDAWVAEAEAALPSTGSLISPAVRHDLRLGLRSTLASAAGRALLELFTDGAGPVGNDLGSRRYRAFVAHVAAGGGHDELIDEFPVLAELLPTLVAQWVAATAEFLQRVEADHGVIVDLLGLPADVPVRRVGPPLGDRHNRGRTVVAVTFGDRHQVAYKPRPLVNEAHVYGLLEQFAPAAGTVPWVVDRGPYGWVQWLTGSPVEDVSTFWRHAGAASAVLSLSGVHDLHMGNIIACEHGIAVLDVECMGKPDSADRGRWRVLTESVLGTGLFPNWFALDGPVAREASGLFGSPFGTDGRWYSRWRRLGTDAIALVPVLGRGVDADGRNRPLRADGRRVVVDLEALIDGFADAAAALRAVPGLETSWPDAATRFLLRSTGVYADRLVEMTTPDALRSHDRFDVAATALPDFGAAWKDALIAGHEATVIASEADALRRLDIPLHRAQGLDLLLDGGARLSDVFELSGSDVRAHKMAALDPPGVDRQRVLLRLHVEQTDPQLVSARPLPKVDATEPIDAAMALAAALASERIDGDDMSSWLEASISAAGVFSGAVDRRDMYDGSDGVGCFFAAVGVLSGDEASRSLARRLVIDRVIDPDEPAGWPAGVAGAAYARLYVGRLLEDPEVLERAADAVRVLLDHAIDPSAPIDLVGGSGGMLAVVSAALAAGIVDDAALPRFEDLTDDYVAAVRHHLADPVLRPHATVLGVAHGARGTIHVLARLGTQLGHAGALDVAGELEAIDRRRSEERGIAASLVRSMPRRPRHGWCAGVSGHAMTSMDGLDRLGGVVDVEAALAELLLDPPEDRHGLCCGVAGVAVAADELCRRFPESGIARQVFERARDALLAAATGAAPVTFIPGCSMHGASLFMGRSGLGWALCRIADPARVPNLLLVD
jgi:type 2 lantibiotic biosynthesis protein LanM